MQSTAQREPCSTIAILRWLVAPQKKKAEAALTKKATQRECMHVCRVPHALCEARHSRARARALLRKTRYALCAAHLSAFAAQQTTFVSQQFLNLPCRLHILFEPPVTIQPYSLTSVRHLSGSNNRFYHVSHVKPSFDFPNHTSMLRNLEPKRATLSCRPPDAVGSLLMARLEHLV